MICLESGVCLTYDLKQRRRLWLVLITIDTYHMNRLHCDCARTADRSTLPLSRTVPYQTSTIKSNVFN